jgi:hypothetical protein
VSPPQVRFLGTGTAFNSDGRGSQALLVQPSIEVAQELALDPIPMLTAAHDGMLWTA